MKESIGGTLLLNLMVFFIIVYIFFMAGIMCYASAYRAKNSVVELIERTQEGTSCGEYMQILKENGYSDAFYVTKHENEHIGKSYYTVELIPEIKVIPGLFVIRVPVVGETRLIDSKYQISEASVGKVSEMYSSSC